MPRGWREGRGGGGGEQLRHARGRGSFNEREGTCPVSCNHSCQNLVGAHSYTFIFLTRGTSFIVGNMK